MKFNSVIPELSVSDFSRSLRFYTDLLGFKVEYDRPIDKSAFLSMENIQLMIEERNGNWETALLEVPFGRGVNFQIELQNLDLLLSQLRGADYPLFREPFIAQYNVGERIREQKQSLIQDPDGYLLRFCEEIRFSPS